MFHSIRRGEPSASAGLTVPRRTITTSGTMIVVSAVLALSALVVGCVVQSGPSSGGGGTAGGGGGWATGSASGSTDTSGSTGSSGDAVPDGGVPPMVVDVDPGGTLLADPGNGVGVFTEYAAGGHWLVWWTCDTNVTGQSCNYRITVSALHGALSSVQGVELEPGDQLTQPSSSDAVVSANTTTRRDALGFDAEPGTSIELTVGLDPQPNTNFLFFVQDQRVNGGYQGSLTDPLILEPLSP